MDLIKQFDKGAFHRALTELMYGGELCDEMEYYPDFHVVSTIYRAKPGAPGGVHSIKHFKPQIPKRLLKAIYKGVKRGSLREMQKVQLLYRMGLGVPRSEILTSLWSTIKPHGAVEMQDGAVIKYKDLLAALKAHLNQAFKVSGSSVYMTDYVMYYQRIHSYLQGTPSKSERIKSRIALYGSRADVFVTYTATGVSMKLSGVITIDNGKILDHTYTARSEGIVPATMPFFPKIKPGQRITFVGKFALRPESPDGLDVNDCVSNLEDLIFLKEALREKEKAIVRERREASYNIRAGNLSRRQEQAFLEKLASVKNRTKKQERNYAKLLEVEKKRKEVSKSFDKKVEAVKKEIRSLPGTALEFVAYDVLSTKSLFDPEDDKPFSTVRGSYSKVVETIQSVGFKTMPVNSVRPRNCKSFIGIAERLTTPCWSLPKDTI